MDISNWLPMSPTEGPPLPKFLDKYLPWGGYWPWYKATTTPSDVKYSNTLIYWAAQGKWAIATNGQSIPKGAQIYLAPGWVNHSTVSVTASINCVVTFPDGTQQALTATSDNNKAAAPNAGWHVGFSPFTSTVGTHKIDIEVLVNNAVVDSFVLTFNGQ